MTVTDHAGVRKYERVAATVRGLIADGTLRPGQAVPSGAALSRMSGYSVLTCRKALQSLIKDGDLVPGPSRNARPRVVGPPSEGCITDAVSALSSGLATGRQAAGLTQIELASLVGCSVTTIGHAETGRVWQSRRFWERADAVLGASGHLLRLHDAYGASTAADLAHESGPSKMAFESTIGMSPTTEAPPTPASIVIVWTDGAITSVPVNRESPMTA